MSRLKLYLIEEELPEIRSKMLTEQEAIDMINKNCSIILDKYKRHPDWKVYRGLKLASNYRFTDPKKGKPRYSKGDIGNYYTLLIDNLPIWKSYPKRSRSIICTTSNEDAENYGNLYVVFPFNNATFGVCPTKDIWISFVNNLNSLRIFSKNLKNILNITTHGITNFDKDWNRLTKSFKKSEEYIKLNKIPDSIFKSNKWIVDITNGESYINTFIKYMNPNKNGFSLTKDPTNITKGRELWTNSKCILIYEKLLDQLLLHL